LARLLKPLLVVALASWAGCCLLLTGTLDRPEEVDQGATVSEVSISARLLNLQTGEVIWQDTKSRRSGNA
jgi:hypothetical protein